MIRFEPFPIVINGNRRDDLLYELWQLGGSKPEEKPGNLDEIELRESIGPEARHYERTIFSCLQRIGRHKSGRCVLAASQKLAGEFHILPLGERDRAIRFDHFWSESCPGANAYARRAGPGVKTTRVLFTPYERGACHEGLNVGEPDVTLLHELVHAVRPHGEKLLNTPTKDAWVNLDEFFAVVVENIYRSERGDKILRGGWDHSRLSGESATSAGFIKDKTLRTRIEDALKREDLAQRLARFPEIPFNPFAAIAKA